MFVFMLLSVKFMTNQCSSKEFHTSIMTKHLNWFYSILFGHQPPKSFEFITMVNRGKGDYQIDYVPAPRITEADKTNDRK